MKIGIGYIFGAKDEGVSRTIGDLNSGLLDTEESAKGASKQGGRLRDALMGIANLQLRDISSQIDQIQAGVQGVAGGGIDTQIESMFTSFDQGFAKAAVMTGKVGGELKALESQVFSTAFAMNRSADEVGANALAIQKAGLSIEAIAGPGGTLADVQKIIEVTGLGAGDFASTFQDLSKSWGMGERGTKEFLDRFTSVNVQLGQGQEAFAALPGIMSAVDQGFAHLDMKPEEIESTVLGITKLGAALVEGLGEDPQKAMDTAASMFTALAEEGKGFDKMVAGMDGGLGQLTSDFAMLGGGLGDSLKAMKDGAKDPAKFMESVATTFAQLDENGSEAAMAMKTRLRMSLSQIAPSFAFLASGGNDTVDVFKDIAKVAPKAGDGLLDVAKKGFRSGLTLQESMDRAKMSMEQAFGGASRKEREAFASSMIKSYGLVGETIKNLTGDNEKFVEGFREQAAGFGMSAGQADKLRGVLGPLVEYLTTFASTGVHGVLIKAFGEDSALAGGIGILASGFGEASMMLLPLLGLAPILAPVFGTMSSAIGTAAAAISSFLLPVAAAAAAIGVLYLAATGQLDDAVSAIKEKLEDAFVFVAGLGTRLLDAVTGFFDGLSGKEIAGNLIAAVKTAFSNMFSVLESDLSTDPEAERAGRGLMDALVRAVKSYVGFASEFRNALFDGVMSGVVETDWKAVGDRLMSSLDDGFNKAMERRNMVGEAVIKYIEDTDWRAVGKSFADKFASMRHSVIEATRGVMADVTDFIRDVDWAEAGIAVGEAFIDGLVLTGKFLLAAVKAMGELVIDTLAYMTTKEFWVDTWSVMVDGFLLALEGFKALDSFIKGVFGGIASKIIEAVFGPDVSARFLNQFRSITKGAEDAFRGFIDAVRQMAYDLFGNSINSFVRHDFGKIEEVLDTAQGWFFALKDIAGTVFESAVGFISGMFEKFKAVGTFIRGIADRFGFTPEQAAELTGTGGRASGGGTDGAAASVIGVANTDLIRVVSKGNADQIVQLKKIVALLGGTAGGTAPPNVPAAPTGTGG